MKPANKLLLCAAMLVLGATAIAEGGDERITASFSDPSRPGILHVGLVEGGIVVKGGDRKNVIVETHSDPELNDEADAPEGMHRLPQQASLAVEEQNNQMSIQSSRPANLEILVPKRTSLQLSTVNNGDIEVEGVDGEFEISNVNGSITLTKVGGSVVAHTVNGTVVATVTRVSLEKPMAFTSLNGAVDVTLPAATKANLKLRSDNGSVFTDFEVGLLHPAPSVDDTRKSGGPYRIEVSKGIYGSLNGGGAEIELRTFNENVFLRKGK